MEFDNRTAELIALGASAAADCQSCVDDHAAKAKQCGIEPADIARAIEIGKTVRAAATAASNQPFACASGPAGWGPWRMSGCCPK